jgi:hypothetical protein
VSTTNDGDRVLGSNSASRGPGPVARPGIAGQRLGAARISFEMVRAYGICRTVGNTVFVAAWYRLDFNVGAEGTKKTPPGGAPFHFLVLVLTTSDSRGPLARAIEFIEAGLLPISHPLTKRWFVKS